MPVAIKTYDHKLNVLPTTVNANDHYFIKQTDGSVKHYIGDNEGVPRLVGNNTAVTDSSTFTGTAGENLGGGKLVYLNAGKFYLYDANNASLADLAFGITKTAAAINASVDVQMSGVFTEVGLGLTPDTDYFAGTNGLLVTNSTPYTTSTLVGIAMTADSLKIEIQQSIIIN